VPELPDIVAYLEALKPRVAGKRLEAVRLGSPFLLRSVEPPLQEAKGKRVLGLRRMGKRIVFELEDELFLILHLMISGRLHWKSRGAKIGGRVALGG
jgi:formamidopyrimidine-DNA glycosylase